MAATIVCFHCVGVNNVPGSAAHAFGDNRGGDSNITVQQGVLAAGWLRTWWQRGCAAIPMHWLPGAYSLQLCMYVCLL